MLRAARLRASARAQPRPRKPRSGRLWPIPHASCLAGGRAVAPLSPAGRRHTRGEWWLAAPLPRAAHEQQLRCVARQRAPHAEGAHVATPARIRPARTPAKRGAALPRAPLPRAPPRRRAHASQAERDSRAASRRVLGRRLRRRCVVRRRPRHPRAGRRGLLLAGGRLRTVRVHQHAGGAERHWRRPGIHGQRQRQRRVSLGVRRRLGGRGPAVSDDDALGLLPPLRAHVGRSLVAGWLQRVDHVRL